MVKQEKEKTKDRYALVEVPTQHSLVFQDSEDESILDNNQLLLEVLNKLDKIEKSVG